MLQLQESALAAQHQFQGSSNAVWFKRTGETRNGMGPE
jgi:hypothetical protein